MTGRIYTCDDRVYDLPALLSWTVTLTGGVPCDSYQVTFLYQKEMADVLSKAASFGGFLDGVLVARGIVDEYTIQLDSQGLTATIAGRGAVARLLDNESRPVTYEGATLEEIIRCHVTPYGIHTSQCANIRADSVYTVAAGSSQWKALADFCRVYGGFLPRFTVDGALVAAPEERKQTALVIDDSVPVLECALREDYYGVLTEALLIDKTQNLSYSVYNQEMIEKCGQCRRVIYTPGQSTWDAMRYTGEYQIAQSKAEAKLMTVKLPGSFLANPGDWVDLKLERMGLSGRFYVTEAESVYSAKNGFTMTLTLKERE